MQLACECEGSHFAAFVCWQKSEREYKAMVFESQFLLETSGVSWVEMVIDSLVIVGSFQDEVMDVFDPYFTCK